MIVGVGFVGTYDRALGQFQARILEDSDVCLRSYGKRELQSIRPSRRRSFPKEVSDADMIPGMSPSITKPVHAHPGEEDRLYRLR